MRPFRPVFFLLLSCLFILAGKAKAQGGSFTYQGRLLINGNPATGVYDMRFQVFDALQGGTAASGLLSVENVPVQNGLFTQNLALGTAPFNGSARYLQISVRPGVSAGPYTALIPRQQIFPAPYAIYSGNSNNLDGLDSTAFLRATPPVALSANQTTTPVLKIVNTASTGTAAALRGEINSQSAASAAILGQVNSNTPGAFSSAVRGINNGTGGLGIGVWGSHNGSGWGVYGTSAIGLGVYGSASAGIGVAGISTNGYGISASSSNSNAVEATSGNGVAVNATSTSGTALRARINSTGSFAPAMDIATGSEGPGIALQLSKPNSTANAINVTQNGLGGGLKVDIPNPSNGARGIEVAHAGVGSGVISTSEGGNALWGIAKSISAAGVIGDNDLGEAVVGRSKGTNGVGAVVGRNDASGYGVRGFNTKTGIGVLGQAGISGGTGTAGRFENVNSVNGANALEAETNGKGNAFTASSTGDGHGIVITTKNGNENNALRIANGRLVLAPQNGMATASGLIDNPIIRITAAGPYTLKTTSIPEGTTIWVINSTGGAVTISNVVGGALNIAANRAQQFIFYSLVSPTDWTATQ